MKKIKWSRIYFAFVLVLMYLPIFYLIFYSFSSGHNMDHFEKFTLRHYQDLFNDNRLLAIFLETILLALLSSLIATIIGTFGAIAISQTKNKKGRKTLLALNNVLMVSPDVIIGASFLIFFTFLGIGLGFGSVLLSHIAFSIPIPYAEAFRAPSLPVLCFLHRPESQSLHLPSQEEESCNPHARHG